MQDKAEKFWLMDLVREIVPSLLKLGIGLFSLCVIFMFSTVAFVGVFVKMLTMHREVFEGVQIISSIETIFLFLVGASLAALTWLSLRKMSLGKTLESDWGMNLTVIAVGLTGFFTTFVWLHAPAGTMVMHPFMTFVLSLIK